jgi:hypothetical protein
MDTCENRTRDLLGASEMCCHCTNGPFILSQIKISQSYNMETVRFLKQLRVGDVVFYPHNRELWPAEVFTVTLASGSVQKNLRLHVNNECYLVKQGWIKPEKISLRDAVEIRDAESSSRLLVFEHSLPMIPLPLLDLIEEYDPSSFDEGDVVDVPSLRCGMLVDARDGISSWQECVVVSHTLTSLLIRPRSNGYLSPKWVDSRDVRPWHPKRIPDLFRLRERARVRSA